MEIKITHTDALFEWCNKCNTFEHHDLIEKDTLSRFLLSCFKKENGKSYTKKCNLCGLKENIICKKRRAQFYRASKIFS